MEGGLDDPDEMSIDVHFLYPMHIGNSGGTTIENYEEILDLYDEKPELEGDEFRQGFIHSHNSMKTFFSATDNTQLIDGAEDFEIFLSVITNNQQDYIAKISFPYEEKVEKSLISRWFSSEETEVTQRTGYLETKLTYEVCRDDNDFIKNRYEEIKKTKTESQRTHVKGYYNNGSVYDNWEFVNGRWVWKGDQEEPEHNQAQQDMFQNDEDYLLEDLTKMMYPKVNYSGMYNRGSRQLLAANFMLKEILKLFTEDAAPISSSSLYYNTILVNSKKIFHKISDSIDGSWDIDKAMKKQAAQELVKAVYGSNYNLEELLAGLHLIDKGIIYRVIPRVGSKEKELVSDIQILLYEVHQEFIDDYEKALETEEENKTEPTS